MPASINIELKLADASQIEKAEHTLLAELRRLGEEPLPDDPEAESGQELYDGSMSEAVDRFYEILHKDHPFGSRPTMDDFDGLNADDVSAYYAKYFVPGNLTIAIAGAIDVDDINARLADLFGDWAAADVPEPKQMPAVNRNGAELHHFPSNKLLSWLVIGHDLPLVPVEEQAALEVMNYIIGAEHVKTRLMVETRYKYGYTNDASGFLEDQWYGPGGYTFRSYSRPEVIENIYRNMLGELIRIRDEEVTDRELFVAIGALADGTFPAMTTASAVAHSTGFFWRIGVVCIISTAEIKSHLHAPLLTADQLVGVPGVAVPEFQSAIPGPIHSYAIN